MDQKEVEFASQTQISAKMRGRLLGNAFEGVLKEKLRNDAKLQGYRATSEPVITWQEQAWMIVCNEDGEFERVRCASDDEGAFFYVGVRMKVVKDA